MPKVTTKRRHQRDQDPMGSVWDFPALQEQGPGPADVEDKPGTSDDLDVKALLNQIRELNSRVEQAERANLALMSTTPTSTTVDKPAPVKYDDLPDPSLEPERYAAELRTRLISDIQAQNNYNQQQSRVQASQEQAVNQLWEDFSETYEDYAGDQEKIEFVAQKVAKRLQTKNIDLQKYMFSNSDRFFRDVVKEYDKTFGKPVTDEDEYEGDYTPREPVRRRSRADDDGDDGRTVGIFGGIESSGRPTRGKEPQGSDMIQDLHKEQRRMGLY